MAENDSVYTRNYRRKWSTLLSQPVSYYDVIFSRLFIISSLSTFVHKKKALEMIIRFCFRGPFQDRFDSIKESTRAE